MSFLSLLLFTLILVTAMTTAQTCYHPNGDAVGIDGFGGAYLPCNGTGMCCALGRPVSYINKCLGNGLCDDVSSGLIWRESCTDPTWKDPNCLKLCTEDTFGSLGAGDVILTPCSDGSFCCGSNNLVCCEKGQGYAIVNGAVIPASASLTTSNSAIRSTTGSTTGFTTSSTAQSVTGTAASVSASLTQAQVLPSTSTSPSTSDKSTLGIGLGAGLGALAAAILVLAVVLWRRKGGGKGARVEQEGQESQNNGIENEEPRYVVTESELAQGPWATELHGVEHRPTVVVELPGEGKVFEK